MPSTKTRLAGLVLGGRNGIGGSASAPLLARIVWSSPSVPTAYTGSTPPKGTGATAGEFGTAAGATGPAGATAAPLPCGAPPRAGRGSLSTAAPAPGAPTALPLRPPRPPAPARPPPAGGPRLVRRLGVAIKPPGQDRELAGGPPVFAE